MRPSRCSAALHAGAVAALVAAALAAPSRPAGAQQLSPGVEGGTFLLLPVGARATALGQAAVADGGTTEAMFWNPAGLAALPQAEFALHHYEAFFGSGDAIAIAVPSARLGSFGFAAYLVNYGDIAVTRADLGSVPVGEISPRNIALMASYATEVVGGLAIGATYKLVQFRVDCTGDCSGSETATGTTQALDLGIRFVSTARLVPVTIGIALRNLGFPLQVQNKAQADPLPTRLVVGISAQVLKPAAGVQGFDARVLADVQSAVGEGQGNPATLVGVETGVGEVLRVRGGYAFLTAGAGGPSLGVGVKLGSIAFDLARVFQTQEIGDQEPVHISFRVIF